MIKVIALWSKEPEPTRYATHAELVRKIPGVDYKHGKIFGSPPGTTPDAAYFAELGFVDMDAFNRAVTSPEFAAVAADGAEFGIPVDILFTEVE